MCIVVVKVRAFLRCVLLSQVLDSGYMKPTMDELERRGYAMSEPAGRSSAFGKLSEKDIATFPTHPTFNRPLVRAAIGAYMTVVVCCTLYVELSMLN